MKTRARFPRNPVPRATRDVDRRAADTPRAIARSRAIGAAPHVATPRRPRGDMRAVAVARARATAGRAPRRRRDDDDDGATTGRSRRRGRGDRARRAGRAIEGAGSDARGTRRSSTRATARRAAIDLRKVIEDLCAGKDLSEADAHAAMEALLDADPTQIAAFLVLLRAKGETASEMAGLARAMQSRAVTVDAGDDVLDIVGTGGDDAGTVNISTGSCVLAAAAGAKVAKHGSRSVSSLCGSGDVLEALGVDIELGPESMKRCVEEVGVGFMFAPRYHPAMAKVSPVRKALKVRTAFNLLGPMLNPAHSKYALVGVYSTGVQQLMADSLMKLGMKKALIVHSMGLDELTPAGPADVVEVTPSGTRAYTFEPKDVDIKPCTLEDLRGGDPTTNARILRAALEGEKGPVAETLILNAGVAMAAAQQAKDVVEGIAMAREAHESGKAGKTLDSWIKLTQELRKTEA